MNVLYLTACSPWDRNFGGALRCAGILRGLVQRHHVEVVFFAPAPMPAPVEPPAGAAAVHVIPLAGDDGAGAWRAYAARRAARQRCRELIERLRPDVIWQFGKAPARIAGWVGAPPLVLDLDNLSWRRLLRQAAQERGTRRARSLLRALASRFDDARMRRRAAAVVLANPDEVRLLRRRRHVHLVHNGADFPDVRPVAARAAKRLLHLGPLWYPPTLDGLRWFYRQVWPRVLAAEPAAGLDVCGWSVPYAAELGSVPQVTVHGLVEDLEPLWRSSSALIVPLRIGSGTRTKVLDAWAHGVPVVATTIGAEGLGAEHDVTALIADDAAAFADACVALLRDPPRGAALAARAFEYGRANFSWPAIYPALETVLAGAVGDPPLRRGW